MLLKKKWDKANIQEELRKIIITIMKPHDNDEAEKTAEEYFKDIDSLRIMELVVKTESRFKIEIPTDQLTSLDEKDFYKFSEIVEKELGGIA